ncbi:MAG: NACHT domain-containing protein [Armatimonadetes bacterium]|nr:NACHT domain-containing protein [Armatimonadota bacterium]
MTDPGTVLVIGTLSGLAANAFTSLIAHLENLGPAAREHREALLRHLEKDASLRTLLDRAVASLAQSLQLEDEAVAQKLRMLLMTPDIEQILRQLYATSLVEGGAATRGDVRAELRASLSVHLRDQMENLDALCDALFNALLRATESALNLAIQQGVLTAHEATSTLRFQILRDELAGVKAKLKLLDSGAPPDPACVAQFERTYRSQVAERHKDISPPLFDAAVRVPIDQIFVPPRLVGGRADPEREAEPVEMASFFASTYRRVVLGNPGGGKSTLATKLTCELAVSTPDAVLPGRDLTPILVIVRDYGAKKKTDSCSILQFIETTARSKYQMPPSPGVFEYLLLNGRALVIFDGLDELLDTAYRQDVTGDIESFCNLYPSVPVLVTSREVGYQQAPLDEERFEVYRLAPFSEQQVKQYATSWFAFHSEESAEERETKVSAFMRESASVPDLRSNPLMLALMCNTYRGEGYIPRNRGDLYEKCTTMLFEKWDKSRGVHVTLPFEALVKPAIQHLAYWIYQDEARQSGVVEGKIVAETAGYLLDRRFETEEEAEGAATQFVDWCTGRAWVFTDTGSTESGARIFQFTHRTFLEYFTAAYLVRVHRTPKDLLAGLTDRIVRREWDVVAQLAFHLHARDIEGASDELIDGLLGLAEGNDLGSCAAALSFAARCLTSVVPSPARARNVVNACVTFCRKWDDEAEMKMAAEQWPEEAYSALASCAAENLAPVRSALETSLTEGLSEGDPDEISRLSEIALHSDCFMTGPGDSEFLRSWQDVENRVWETCGERMLALATEDPKLVIWPYWRGRLDVTGVIETAGFTAAFASPTLRLTPVHLVGVAVGVATSYRDAQLLSSAGEGKWKTRLRQFAEAFVSARPPWVTEVERYSDSVHDLNWTLGRYAAKTTARPDLPSDLVFGLGCILAVLGEIAEKAREMSSKSLANTLREDSLLLDDHPALRELLLARFEATDEETVNHALDKCRFNAEQRDLLRRWALKQVDFTG